MTNDTLTKNDKNADSKQQLIEERREQIVKVAIKLFSELGYYRTTIQKIAEAADFSQGFIYQYFKNKDELLLYSLLVVLKAYQTEIPRKLEGINHPIDKLCATISAFCTTVDDHREATVLAYRSTKSLPQEKRQLIKDSEIKSNQYLYDSIDGCVEDGFMIEVDVRLLAYQHLMFCHAWALKNWAYKDLYSLEDYIAGGLELMVKPFLTPKGLDYWSKYYAPPKRKKRKASR